MGIPEIIGVLAQRHGSVAAAARAIGMPETTLHRLYREERRPNLDTLRVIAQGLDMPLHELIRLLEGDEEMPQTSEGQTASPRA